MPLAADFSKLPRPLHGLITGSKSEQDRRIVIDQAPRFAIVGQDQKLVFHVEDQGGDGTQVKVTINMDGLDQPAMSVPPGTKIELPFKLTHAGQNLVELSAAERASELSLANNHAIVSISGVRDRLRVLLVSGEPHPGERTWRDLLKADASVDLVHFTILRPPEKQDGTPTKELSLIAFPTRELFFDKLSQFDLVIFDRYQRQVILPDAYMANIAEYVRKGGALLLASGPDYAEADGLYTTPLNDVLAAAPTGDKTETPFKPAITEAGKRHPVTQNLPGSNNGSPTWGRWFRLIDTQVKDGAEVLMSGPNDKPLLVLNHAGEGRVAQLLSDHGWLWARGFEGGGPQTELLRRMAHWLMKEPDLEEESLSSIQVGNDIVITRRTMEDSVKPITINSPSGAVQTVTPKFISPGLFKAQFPVKELGLSTMTDGKLQAAIAIGLGDGKEQSDIRSTTTKLLPVTTATNGGTFWMEDGFPQLSKSASGQANAGAGWMSLRANNQFRVLAIRQISLFSTLLSLAALLLAASLMWFREGR